VLAQHILKENNPNDLSWSGDWFDGLGPAQKRFVPYNGACSSAQLIWLANALERSKAAGGRVIIFCH
jgi:hypothetical protein